MKNIESVAAEAAYIEAKILIVRGVVPPDVSALQRHLGIGYNVARKYLDRMIEENLLELVSGDSVQLRLKGFGMQFGLYTIVVYGAKKADKVLIEKAGGEGGQFDIALVEKAIDELYKKHF